MFLNTLLLAAAVLYGAALAFVPHAKEYGDTNLLQNLEESEESSEFKIPGLYWEPYTGAPVPKNAVLAGITKVQGEEIGVYIGQAPVDVPGAQVQAAAIYNNSEYITSTYTRTVQTKDNVKILCAEPHVIESKLTWIPADLFDQFDPDEDFVIIGHEHSKVTQSDTNLFIGRGVYRNNFVVGKVVMGFTSFRFYPYVNGHETLIKDDFEILAYSNSYFKLKEN